MFAWLSSNTEEYFRCGQARTFLLHHLIVLLKNFQFHSRYGQFSKQLFPISCQRISLCRFSSSEFEKFSYSAYSNIVKVSTSNSKVSVESQCARFVPVHLFHLLNPNSLASNELCFIKFFFSLSWFKTTGIKVFLGAYSFFYAPF